MTVNRRLSSSSRSTEFPYLARCFPSELSSGLEVAKALGWVLARAHARSADAAVISGYLGAKDVFDKALAQFSVAYADQTERDYQSFVQAVDSGRLEVHRES